MIKLYHLGPLYVIKKWEPGTHFHDQKHLCERMYLVSSDTDLIPAIQKVQEKGKTVVYVGFSHQVSKALVASCKETQTLTKETIQPFIAAKQTEQTEQAA